MKETRFILGKKQADNSIIYVKGMSGEEVERAFNYYEAQDYKSLAYARATRDIFESLKEFDIYIVNIEIHNEEETREVADDEELGKDKNDEKQANGN